MVQTLYLRYSTITKIILLWSILGFPFVASITNALGLSSTGIVILVRALIAALCLVLIARSLNSRRRPLSIAFVLLVFFFAAYILRLGYDTALAAHLLARPLYMYWAFAVGVCILPALSVALYADHLVSFNLYRPLMILSAVVLVLAITTGGTMMEGSLGDMFDAGRLKLESLNPISLGHLGATVIILAYWRIRMMGSTLGVFALSVGLGSIAIYVLFAAGSRGPVVALIVALLFFEAVKGGKTAIWVTLAATPFLTVLTVDVAELEAALGTNLLSRFDMAITFSDASSTGRLAQLSSAWRLFLDAPLLGWGLEDTAFGIYPHNIIVEAFMATGVFGGASLVMLLVMVSFRAFFIARRDAGLSIYGALFVQYLLGAQFSGSLYTSSTFWVLLAFIASFTVPRWGGLAGAQLGKQLPNRLGRPRSTQLVP